MKKVIIKRLSLLNFKGLREFQIEFSDSMTSVLGKNGSGKTTIFDAFTWLLFGKDSEDRKSFNIKTLDAQGVAIPRIPHEVSAILTVDDEEISLCRRYSEKWQKKRGSATEEFTGHEEERLYNDVPMSVKEWGEKIISICSEQVFKFITNPLYFSAQKTDTQRAMLFRMAGTISDEEIAAGNADFMDLLAKLTGKSMEEYKREIAAKKRRIKAEIDGIPERIDERKRDMPEAENWLLLEADLEAKKSELEKVEKSISDKSQAYSEASKAKLEIAKKEFDLRQRLLNREHEIKQSVLKEYNEQSSQQSELRRQVESAQAELGRVQSEMTRYQRDLEAMQQKRSALIAEWKEINARTLQFNQDEFVCPTCKRPLDIDDIERKQSEMTENFNTRKANDLAENNRKGQANKKAMDETMSPVKKCEERISELSTKIESLKANPLYTSEMKEPDATPTIEADAERKKILNQIAEVKAELDKPNEAPDTSELTEQKKSIISEIDIIKAKLAKKETIERNEARIKELEKQLREQSEELAQLEGIEFTMAAFSKARIEAVENRINGLFSIVKFKMFEQQINGGEVETCEATVNGVPYSDLNNAMTINAGLDIINAICKSEGVTAPIFIDNAESVNELLHTQSQMIRLVVTDDETLRVQ